MPTSRARTFASLRVASRFACAAALALACVSPTVPPQRPPIELFAPPAPDDMFSPLIRLWQASERWEAGRAGSAPLAPRGEFEEQVRAFGHAQKLRIARETLRWTQAQSLTRFRADANGDQWPTLTELFARGEDDCDGLELVSFHLLRRMGFAEGEIYRAVLRSSDSRQYHMVTLWFDAEPPSDPFVIDPTGWIAQDLVRLSALGAWHPLRLFDEDQQFTALELPGPSSARGEVAER